MEQGYFITGTDTGVGKTWATVALMRHFKALGKTVVGMKPVASGCAEINGRLRNEDALLLQENASVPVGYEQVNPYAYKLPVSPHLASVDNPVRLDEIASIFSKLQKMADIVLVEGVGGWLAPLNDRSDVADLAGLLNLPVIMVVAVKLGCINHARLTQQAIAHTGLACAGWVAVCSDANMLLLQENIQTLQKSIKSSLLGVLPFQKIPDFDGLASHLEIPQIK